MKLNKRALLVEGIVIYEILLNYIVFPLDIFVKSATPALAKIVFNTLVFGVFLTFLGTAISVAFYQGISSIIKWINEDLGD